MIRGKDGVLFHAAVTHREKKGVHLVVLTSSTEHLARLRDNAPAIVGLLAQQHGVSGESIRDFARCQEGAIFEVNTRIAAPLAAGTPATARRGRWCDEAKLKKRLGKVRLPEINQALTMTQHALQMTQVVATSAQKAAKATTRVLRPHYPRPH